ncbi:MAG: inner membrane CreD family protein [Candidatus Hydrogenedentes bacterium]|nr:inner membrane CreD family protein [Candidatus Hydrogenedentota bacterium]
MSFQRIVVVGLILLVASAGWFVLGMTTEKRSTDSSSRLGEAVQALWGAPLVQQAPSFGVEIPGANRVRWLMPAENKLSVALQTDYRRKGLIWYPTYTADFDGSYTLTNTEDVAQKVRLHFDFPAKNGTYDRFTATLDGKKLLSPVNTAEGLNEMVELAPGMSTRFHVTYRARGMAAWRYGFDPQVGRVQNLDLSVKTNFEAVDYPEGCLSPMSAQAAPEGGVMLAWQASDLITREGIGVIIPEKLNPGPLTSRITYFAPVCLIFFFVLVGTINIIYKVDIHPMHYLFVAAGFFAFHLLLAYMAGLILIHVAFLISAVVSVGLVTTYLSAALRGQFPWKVAAAGQVFFLVLFSYSFFLKGITGLTVAIGSVVTLAVLMRVTAHVDWNEVFAKKPALPVAVPAPPPLPQV